MFFVALEDAARPKWVPDTHIHFDLNQYSLEELAGAIKARAQELGSELRKENPMERARRAQARVAFEEETRNLFHREEGVKLARAEARKVCDIMEPVVTNAAEELGIRLRKARQVPHGIEWSTPKAAMTATFQTAVNMLDQNDALEVWMFKHDIVLPGENGFYMEPGLPERHCRDKYKPRRTMSLGWCWEIHDGKLINSAALAEKILDDFWTVYEDAVINPLQFDWSPSGF